MYCTLYYNILCFLNTIKYNFTKCIRICYSQILCKLCTMCMYRVHNVYFPRCTVRPTCMCYMYLVYPDWSDCVLTVFISSSSEKAIITCPRQLPCHHAASPFRLPALSLHLLLALHPRHLFWLVRWNNLAPRAWEPYFISAPHQSPDWGKHCYSQTLTAFCHDQIP